MQMKTFMINSSTIQDYGSGKVCQHTQAA